MNKDLMIIIVDDELEALTHFLYQVVEEKNICYKFFNTNPLEAIDYVKKHAVDAAYLDIRMATINGLDLAKELIKVNPSIKIVFITAFSFDEKQIREEFKNNLVDFVYKPFNYERIKKSFILLGIEKHSLSFQTFGEFNFLVDNHHVHFVSKKSEELLALILTFEGKLLTMETAINLLWPFKELDLAKRLYRDSVYKLRQKLNEFGIANLVIFQRGATRLNTDFTTIECDYWNYLRNKEDNSYNGYFLTSYSWNKPIKALLDKKKEILDEEI